MVILQTEASGFLALECLGCSQFIPNLAPLISYLTPAVCSGGVSDGLWIKMKLLIAIALALVVSAGALADSHPEKLARMAEVHEKLAKQAFDIYVSASKSGDCKKALDFAKLSESNWQTAAELLASAAGIMELDGVDSPAVSTLAGRYLTKAAVVRALADIYAKSCGLILEKRKRDSE